MSALAILLPELLLQIMLWLEEVDHKVVAAQVCQQWRNTAIGAPHFWSSFRASSTRDFHQLLLALGRSGTILLDIDLFVMDRSPNGLDLALGTLESYAPRIRKLRAVFGFIITSPVPLLCSGLYLPEMTSLHLEGPGFTASPPMAPRGIEINLFAPKLRDLALCHIILRGPLSALLVASLRRLRLLRCTGPDCTWSTFGRIFRRCLSIEELSLDQYHTWGRVQDGLKVELDPLAPLAPALPNLHSLVLTLVPNESTSYFLELALHGQIIRHITCFVDDSPGLVTVISLLLRGLEPVYAVEFSNNASITLYDLSNRVRSLQSWDCDRISVTAVWAQLSQNHGLTASLRHIRIVQPYWNKLVRALDTYPLPYDSRDAVTLHISIEVGDARKFAHGRLGHMRELRLPGLKRVLFSATEGVLTPDLVIHFLEVITGNDGTSALDISLDNSARFSDVLEAELEETLAAVGGGQWRFLRRSESSARPGEAIPWRQGRTVVQEPWS